MHSVRRPILLVLLVPIINLLNTKMPVKINRRSKVLMQLKTAVLTAVIIIWDAVIKKHQGGNNNVPRVQQPAGRGSETLLMSEMGETINVKDFANLLKREVSEVIKSLFMLGVIVTINQDIDFDTALLVGSEFDVEVAALPPEGSD